MLRLKLEIVRENPARAIALSRDEGKSGTELFMDRYQSVRRECLDGPPNVPDGVVLSVAGFPLPGADLFPQVHHLAVPSLT